MATGLDEAPVRSERLMAENPAATPEFGRAGADTVRQRHFDVSGIDPGILAALGSGHVMYNQLGGPSPDRDWSAPRWHG